MEQDSKMELHNFLPIESLLNLKCIAHSIICNHSFFWHFSQEYFELYFQYSYRALSFFDDDFCIDWVILCKHAWTTFWRFYKTFWVSIPKIYAYFAVKTQCRSYSHFNSIWPVSFFRGLLIHGGGTPRN